MKHNSKFTNQHGPLATLARAGHGAINAVRMAIGEKELVSFDQISDRRAQMYEASVLKIIGNRKITDSEIHEHWIEMAGKDDELKSHKNRIVFEDLDKHQQAKVTGFRRVVLDLIDIVL